MVTVCAVTVDFSFDVSGSSSCDDGVEVAVPAVAPSDSGSFSTLAGDESSVPDALGDGAESDDEDEGDDEVSDDADSDELDSPSSADAVAAPLAIATPIPKATASPPTLPMKRP
jgi:hypothetical protein